MIDHKNMINIILLCIYIYLKKKTRTEGAQYGNYTKKYSRDSKKQKYVTDINLMV